MKQGFYKEIFQQEHIVLDSEQDVTLVRKQDLSSKRSTMDLLVKLRLQPQMLFHKNSFRLLTTLNLTQLDKQQRNLRLRAS